jgi:hypothetical protein
MKNIAITVGTAIALSLETLGLAGAAVAAPDGPANVSDTISALKQSGYTVIVNRFGAAPLSACTVGAIRPGQAYSRTDSGAPGAHNNVITTVQAKTVYLDANC